jgi:hypothetical protein
MGVQLLLTRGCAPFVIPEITHEGQLRRNKEQFFSLITRWAMGLARATMDTDVPVSFLIATILCAAAFGWVAFASLPW